MNIAFFGSSLVSACWNGAATYYRGLCVFWDVDAPESSEVLQYLCNVPEQERRALGQRARARVMNHHTAAHRAEELEGHALCLLSRRAA